MIAYDEINKWLKSYYDENTECTVFELILCIVLVPEKIEAYNPIQLPLFVPKWPHWLLQFSGFTFYIKTYNAI